MTCYLACPFCSYQVLHHEGPKLTKHIREAHLPEPTVEWSMSW